MSKKKILVVDDLQLARMTIKRVLTAAGYDVILASSGEMALKMIGNNIEVLDLLLIDIIMPVMDGFTFLATLKDRFGDSFNVPIIFLTARESKDDVLEAIKLGAKDYIVKPFNSKNVLAKIKKYI